MKASQRDAADRLRQIAVALGLTDAQLADLFRIDTALLDRWRSQGVDESRLAAVNDVMATVGMLEHQLKPGMLAALAVRPTEHGGRTLLELLADDPAAARKLYETAFDFTSPA